MLWVALCCQENGDGRAVFYWDGNDFERRRLARVEPAVDEPDSRLGSGDETLAVQTADCDGRDGPRREPLSAREASDGLFHGLLRPIRVVERDLEVFVAGIHLEGGDVAQDGGPIIWYS